MRYGWFSTLQGPDWRQKPTFLGFFLKLTKNTSKTHVFWHFFFLSKNRDFGLFSPPPPAQFWQKIREKPMFFGLFFSKKSSFLALFCSSTSKTHVWVFWKKIKAKKRKFFMPFWQNSEKTKKLGFLKKSMGFWCHGRRVLAVASRSGRRLLVVREPQTQTQTRALTRIQRAW